MDNILGVSIISAFFIIFLLSLLLEQNIRMRYIKLQEAYHGGKEQLQQFLGLKYPSLSRQDDDIDARKSSLG